MQSRNAGNYLSGTALCVGRQGACTDRQTRPLCHVVVLLVSLCCELGTVVPKWSGHDDQPPRLEGAGEQVMSICLPGDMVCPVALWGTPVRNLHRGARVSMGVVM